MKPITLLKLAELKRGDCVILSDPECAELESVIEFRSIRNPRAAGTLDTYLAWIGDKFPRALLPSRAEPIRLPLPSDPSRILKIKRNSTGKDYHAFIGTGRERVRFGNARDILEDVAHFFLTGNLPPMSARAG